MIDLKIILASTRPGRKGPAVAEWVMTQAKAHDAFKAELLDLAVINLPFLDEKEHPRLKKYEHQHTKDWSAKIDPADAFIFVTCEYNFSFPAPLKNALDFLYQEWNHKPAAFVSYGGIAGGIRAVEALKNVLVAQKMTPLTESVHIPFFTQHIVDGVFQADEKLNKSAEAMFKSLQQWVPALKMMRS